MQKAFATVIFKALNEEAREIEGIASTVSPDRYQDIVHSKGARFKLPLPFLSHHNPTEPIGEVTQAKVTGEDIRIKARIVKNSGLDYVETAWKQIKAGLVKGLSIGFAAVDGKTKYLNNGGIEFLEWEWFELSAVSIPANVEATIQTIKHLSPHGLHSAEGKPKQTAYTPAISLFPKGVKMNISERLAELSVREAEYQKTVDDFRSLAESEDFEGFTDEQDQAIAEAQGNLKATRKGIESLQRLQTEQKERAVPVAKVYPKGPPAKHRERPGSFLFKIAAVQFLAHNTRENCQQLNQRLFGNDERLERYFKTATPGADTTTQGWASELVAEDMQGFLDLLVASSVYARVAAMGTQYEFTGAGSIPIPKRTNTSRLSGAFVGEAGVIPVKAGSFGEVELLPYDLGVISYFTKKLARSTPENIERIIRDAMTDDTGEYLDTIFLDAVAAVTGVRPAGIRNGVTPTNSAGTTVDNINADLRAALSPMLTNKAGRRPVILMHTNLELSLMMLTTPAGGYLFREEMAGGRLLIAEYIATPNVPDNILIGLDAADFVSAAGGPMFETSDVPTLTVANADDTAPTQATDGAGALGTPEQVKPDSGISVVGGESGVATAGYQAVSMFQTNQVAVKMVWPASWLVARPENIGVVDQIAW